MKEQLPKPDQVILDDDILLADRLLRSLHRNPDGHLCATVTNHHHAIQEDHNVVILYIYTHDADGLYTMHEHYVYSDKSHNYKVWKKIATDEAAQLARTARKDFHGVYGWQTSRVQITPLRTGDLFIKVDDAGAHGVRLSFSASKAKRKTRKST